jgi:hypothetical protein
MSVPPTIPGDANFSVISTGIINMNLDPIINLADPIEPTDAVNKRYVDETFHPGGLNTDVQYNNNGVFAGNSAFTFDGLQTVTVGDSSQNQWNFDTKIPNNTPDGHVFGYSLDLFNSFMYVGTSDSGVQVFQNLAHIVSLLPDDGIGNFIISGVSGGATDTTQIVLFGSSQDNSYVGAAWIYKGINGGGSPSNWSEVIKIVPNDIIGNSSFGTSVSLVVSGNIQTALIGGPLDNGVGAAWIYQNTGSGWTEITKIISTDNIGSSNFGFSVSLSISGTTYTAVIGGNNDNSSVGATWIYKGINGGGSAGNWSEVTKIIPNDEIGNSNFGQAVSLFINGSTQTIIIGGNSDNNGIGAAWIYQSTGGVTGAWSEVTKIIPTDSIGSGQFGFSVDITEQQGILTAIIGGPDDYSGLGAAWIYNNPGSGWIEVEKLLPLNNINASLAGYSVSIIPVSTSEFTATFGGYGDGTGTNGAVWIYNYNPTNITLSNENIIVPGTLTVGLGTFLSGDSIYSSTYHVNNKIIIGPGSTILNNVGITTNGSSSINSSTFNFTGINQYNISSSTLPVFGTVTTFERQDVIILTVNVSFTTGTVGLLNVINSNVVAGSFILLTVLSQDSTTNNVSVNVVSTSNGSFQISICNVGATILNQNIRIGFVIIGNL